MLAVRDIGMYYRGVPSGIRCFCSVPFCVLFVVSRSFRHFGVSGRVGCWCSWPGFIPGCLAFPDKYACFDFFRNAALLNAENS